MIGSKGLKRQRGDELGRSLGKGDPNNEFDLVKGTEKLEGLVSRDASSYPELNPRAVVDTEFQM